MGRLTKSYVDKSGYTICERTSTSVKVQELVDKLAHYEDLEEQGRLIFLPCKVGDTVWNVNEYADGFKIRPMEVESMTIKEGNKSIVYLAYLDKPDGLVHGYGFDDFGYVLFLTKEEAEEKLKRLQEIQ